MTKKSSDSFIQTISIVGAGFSGLITAYFCLKRNYKVILYEENKIGGLLTTVVKDENSVTFNPYEFAANGLLKSELIEQIANEISATIVFSDKKKTRHRYFFFNEKLVRWPLTTLQTLCALMHFLKSLLTLEYKPKKLETVKQYGVRLFGNKFTTNVLLVALKGIYGKNTSELSATLVFKKKLTPAKRTISFDKGMEFFCKKLFSYLSKHENFLFVNKKFSLAERNFERLIICTNAKSASEILCHKYNNVSTLLAEIEYENTLTVTIQLLIENLNLEGFGCLNSDTTSDANSFLGVLFNHCIYPNRYNLQSFTLIYSMGPQKYKILSQTDIKELAINDLEKILKLEINDSIFKSCEFKYWPVSFPKYNVKLEEILPKLKLNLLNSNIYLNSNYLGYIGLTQICQQSYLLVNSIDINQQGQK